MNQQNHTICKSYDIALSFDQFQAPDSKTINCRLMIGKFYLTDLFAKLLMHYGIGLLKAPKITPKVFNMLGSVTKFAVSLEHVEVDTVRLVRRN